MKKLQQLVFVLSLLFSLEGNAQSWFSVCGDYGLIKEEEQDSITRLWVEGGFWSCYGTTDEIWLEWRIFCKADMSSEVYETGEFDTLKLLLPSNSQTIVTCRKIYRRNDWKWSIICPNICLLGNNDITCFRQPINQIVVSNEPPPSYTIEAGCIIASSEAVIVQWPMMEPTNISVETILGNPYCLDNNTCFYLIYQNGYSTQIVCIN